MESRSETKRLAMQGAKLYTQAELDEAVAGAYLDAAEYAKGRPSHTGGYIAPDILARTPDDAKAALERRVAEAQKEVGLQRDEIIGWMKQDLADREATIERLQAELAAAKRYLQWALPFLPATWPCSYSDTLTSAIEQSRAYSDNLKAAIDAAKGGQQL